MPQEKRQFERFDKQIKINFEFFYDATTKVKYQVVDQDNSVEKYEGISKNICATGLCFTSDQKLKEGQTLHLEVYLPRAQSPIHMDGQVRWCDLSQSNKEKFPRFDTGVRLMSVEGQPVDNSVHFDETYHVMWSNVLESIFGTFRKLMQI